LSSRFAAVRVRPAHQDHRSVALRSEEWLLIEWPKGEAEPAKYWLANLPAEMPLARLVPIAKMRWRIERDYRELKQEFGLSHYEERGWRGFHHHATLCIAAYGYLMAGALAMETPKKNGAQPQTSALPADYVPRGSGSRTAALPDSIPTSRYLIRTRPCPKTRAMSVLRRGQAEYMTQSN
jgi:SRSO17 transposase